MVSDKEIIIDNFVDLYYDISYDSYKNKFLIKSEVLGVSLNKYDFYHKIYNYFNHDRSELSITMILDNWFDKKYDKLCGELISHFEVKYTIDLGLTNWFVRDADGFTYDIEYGLPSITDALGIKDDIHLVQHVFDKWVKKKILEVSEKKMNNIW